MPVHDESIDRREAIRRVGMLVGGLTLAAGSRSRLGAAVRIAHERIAAGDTAMQAIGDFTRADIAFLDEVADTMLPATTTPGAKAAHTGAFMALMVTDTYNARDQKIFRDGMDAIEAESRKESGAGFMHATPKQRLKLLQRLDREQKAYTDARDAARKARRQKDIAQKADAYLPDQRKELAPTPPDANAAPAITADSPAHYFRLMKELALLGYFTSEIGYTQAMRYVESPGRFDPCVPYKPGERSWAAHA